MLGPVPDQPTDYLLPPGTRCVDWDTCPGAVMNDVLGCGMKLELQHPYVTLTSPNGWSGVMTVLVAKP